jgi:hypothetical protein
MQVEIDTRAPLSPELAAKLKSKQLRRMRKTSADDGSDDEGPVEVDEADGVCGLRWLCVASVRQFA